MTHGHAFGSPRRYDIFADISFFGLRRRTFQALVVAAQVRPGQRVLDVGCGTGYLARLLAQAVGPEGLVIGIDPSPEMVAYARRETGGAGNCHFQAGSAESLPFPDDHFDIVITSLVMHHLPEDLQLPALREMRRVLQPGGTLLVADAQIPQGGLAWRLLGAITGHDRLAGKVPALESLADQAGFAEVYSGAMPPWLRYVHAVKPARAE